MERSPSRWLSPPIQSFPSKCNYLPTPLLRRFPWILISVACHFSSHFLLCSCPIGIGFFFSIRIAKPFSATHEIRAPHKTGRLGFSLLFKLVILLISCCFDWLQFQCPRSRPFYSGAEIRCGGIQSASPNQCHHHQRYFISSSISITIDWSILKFLLVFHAHFW